jgi:oligosaccharide repeat unit polymerase
MSAVNKTLLSLGTINKLLVLLAVSFSAVSFAIYIADYKNNSYSIIPAFTVLCLAFFMRLACKSWFHPGSFFSLFWGLILVLSFFFAPNYELQPAPLWWIVLSVIAVNFGSYLGSSIAGYRGKEVSNHRRFNGRLFVKIPKMLVIFSIIGFIGINVLIDSTGKNIFSLLSLQSTLDISLELSRLRYGGGDFKQPIFYTLLFPGVLVGIIFSGVLYAVVSNKIINFKYSYFLVITPFILILLNTIIKTQRGTLLFGVILWTSSFFATKVYLNKNEVKLFTFKIIFNGILILAIFMFAYVILQFFREGEYANDFLSKATENLASAVFGSSHAFSFWFENQLFVNQHHELGWGEFTVNRIAYYVFDVPPRQPGLFGDSIWLGDTYRSGTTVYTVFRGLIQDYSLFGSLVVLFIWSYIAGYSYNKIMSNSIVFIPILILFYSFTMVGYLASIFNWNNVMLAFLIIQSFFIINNKGQLYQK